MSTDKNHGEALDEMLRRATATAEETGGDIDYEVPENPYERQALDKYDDSTEENATVSAEKKGAADNRGKSAPNGKEKGAKAAKKTAKKVKDVSHTSTEEEEGPLTLKDFLGGSFLGRKWFRKNVGYISLIAVLFVLYIYVGYAVEEAQIQQRRLIKQLQDRQLRELTLKSQLTNKTRYQYLEEKIDTTLSIPKDYIFGINTSPE